jgi:hypothetical protein
LCFNISDLEKKSIPIDNFNKPKLENKKEHVKLKGIENTLNNGGVVVLVLLSFSWVPRERQGEGRKSWKEREIETRKGGFLWTKPRALLSWF